MTHEVVLPPSPHPHPTTPTPTPTPTHHCPTLHLHPAPLTRVCQAVQQGHHPAVPTLATPPPLGILCLGPNTSMSRFGSATVGQLVAIYAVWLRSMDAAPQMNRHTAAHAKCMQGRG
jgi:hypothetical protein